VNIHKVGVLAFDYFSMLRQPFHHHYVLLAV